MKADIVIYDKNGQISVIVEVKRKSGMDADWVSKWRRNILAHGHYPVTRFFMVASPDRFYLWKDVGNTPEIVKPTFEIDARPILESYLTESGISETEMTSQSFELVISSWLNSLLNDDYLPEKNNGNLKWIKQTGLHESLKGGRLEHEVSL
ncbi:MAG: hypothetical protein V2I97_17300 [Desulfococcaceae bacterium]|jgi:hypothetical protein|nr:hypothetical protein [Desulfococcaceae bacterium]